VLGVAVIVEALGVVQECEPSQDGRVEVHGLGKASAVKPHPAPVRQAVNAIREVEPEVRAYLCQRLVYDEPAALIRLTIHVSQPLIPRAIAFCEATRDCLQTVGDLPVMMVTTELEIE